MDGFVLGGGMGLVQGADLRLVTERSCLAMPEAGIGYFPMWWQLFPAAHPGRIGDLPGGRADSRRRCAVLRPGRLVHGQRATGAGFRPKRLDSLQWNDTPLKDLQGLLAQLAVQHLPEPLLHALRPVIDHFFALPDVPSIIEQLRSVTVADSHQWALDTANLLQTRLPAGDGRNPGNCPSRPRTEPGTLLCPGAAPGPPMVRPRRPDRRRARPADR